MITQCCIHELYLQGTAVQPYVDLAKTFERRKCNHKEAIPGDECISSVIGEYRPVYEGHIVDCTVGDSNKHRYIVATQSQPLRSKLRAIPAVPVLHITRSVMILEPMSEISQQAKARVRTSLIFTNSFSLFNARLSNKHYYLRPRRLLHWRRQGQSRKSRPKRSARV